MSNQGKEAALPTTEATVIEREVRISASPETVFAFFTDPQKYVRWKGRHAELDPRPGGLFRVEFEAKDVARGEFLEIEPYRRIVFTWGWEGEGHPIPPGSSTVEVTLVPDGDATVVRLVHHGLPEAAIPRHAEGWDLFLPRLVDAVAEHTRSEG
jgi:uncharacterized protein YndB with AHSA1/START domain